MFFKVVIGSGVVLLIQCASTSKHFFLAGLVPLFPAFALISHYVIATERSTNDLRECILFGVLSLLPYCAYLLSLYFMVERFTLVQSLCAAVLVWMFVAANIFWLWDSPLLDGVKQNIRFVAVNVES